MHDTICHKLLRSDHVLMIFYWIHDAYYENVVR